MVFIVDSVRCELETGTILVFISDKNPVMMRKSGFNILDELGITDLVNRDGDFCEYNGISYLIPTYGMNYMDDDINEINIGTCLDRFSDDYGDYIKRIKECTSVISVTACFRALE
jgi:hypothetical protein